MTPITSQPYRVSPADRSGVGKALARGLRPLVLNGVVLTATFAVILWADMAVLDPVISWTEGRVGEATPLVAGAVAALIFVVPWLICYLAWRRIWLAIIRRRVVALVPEPDDLVATLDETGIRVDEGGVASNWLAWPGVTRMALVGDTVVLARGTFGLMVSVRAIGGTPGLRAMVERLDPAVVAALDRNVRDALA